MYSVWDDRLKRTENSVERPANRSDPCFGYLNKKKKNKPSFQVLRSEDVPRFPLVMVGVILLFLAFNNGKLVSEVV